MFLNSDSGDSSLDWSQYKIFADFGYRTSNCDTDIEDLPTSPTYGPIKYQCTKWELAHQADGIIWKFKSEACRNGSTHKQARFKAAAESRSMIFKEELDAKSDANSIFISDRQSERCTQVAGGPDDAGPATSAGSGGKTDAHPDMARFIFHSHDRYKLAVRFYSDTRPGHAWPGPEQHFDLGRDDTYNLTCEAGEHICYGVWREFQSVTWGLGREATNSCTGCCIHCGGNLEQTFNDGGPDAGPPPAVFVIHNRDRYSLGLEFFSMARSGVTWPGSDQEYKLERDGNYRLACQKDERICFGAWRDYQTLYWGSGHKGVQGCQHCCTVCGEHFETTLSDGGPDAYPSVSSGGGGDGGGGGGVDLNSTLTGVADMLNAATSILGAARSFGGRQSEYVPSFHPRPPPNQSTITGGR